MKHFILFSLLALLLSFSIGCSNHHHRKIQTAPILTPKVPGDKRPPIITPEKETKKEKDDEKKHKDRYAVCYKGKTKYVKEKNVEKFLRKGAYFGKCR